MSPFGQYLLTVVCAATIASIAISITADNGSAGKLVKMIAGLFVVITMIYPLKKLSFASITDIWSDLSVDASAIVEDRADLAKALPPHPHIEFYQKLLCKFSVCFVAHRIF